MKFNRDEALRLAMELDARRVQRGLTHAEIGQVVGASQSQVSRICAGKFSELSYNLMQICKILGVEQPHAPFPPADEQRLTAGILRIWDRTTEDADRLLRLLDSVNEVRTVTLGRRRPAKSIPKL